MIMERYDRLLLMNRNHLKIIYLLLGSIGFVLFLWTGRIMRFGYPDKENMEMGFRVMLRSRHIFLLLFSLLEIGIGVYIVQAKNRAPLLLQIFATALIIAAHALFVYGFFGEVAIENVPETPAVHCAAYLVLAGISLHLLRAFIKEE